jgi:hypothetical protein
MIVAPNMDVIRKGNINWIYNKASSGLNGVSVGRNLS